MTVAADYGASAADLETLRRLVGARCKWVRFGGFTMTGARAGAYSFVLFGRSRRVWVQAPLTPSGRRRRNAKGRWRFRQTAPGPSRVPWEYAGSVDEVVDWLCAKAGR